MRSSSLTFGVCCGAALAACSVVNAPDDILPPQGQGGQGAGGGQVTGGDGGTSTHQGAGGDGGGGQAPACGNGQLEDGEDCDEAGDTAGCDADCTKPECGDGHLNTAAEEACDDGNTDAGDACSPGCALTELHVDNAASNPTLAVVGIQPAVVATGSGDEERFVLAWPRVTPGGQTILMQKQTFTTHGTRVDPMPVALSKDGGAFGAHLAANPGGRVALVWAGGVDKPYVMLQLLEPNGAPDGPAVAMAGTAPLGTGLPELVGFDVAAADSGTFCVAWHEEKLGEHKVTCVDPAGKPLGNTKTLGKAAMPLNGLYGSLAIWAVKGGFVTAWYDAAGVNPLVGKRMTNIGTEAGPSFTVSGAKGQSWIGNGHGGPGGDAFVVSLGLQAPKDRPYFRLFDALDKPAGPETLASAVDTDERDSHVVRGPDGRFLVLWTRGASNTCTLHSRLFDAAGKAISPESLVVDQVKEQCPYFVSAAADSTGDVMVVWTTVDNTNGAKVYAGVRAMLYPRLLAP